MTIRVIDCTLMEIVMINEHCTFLDSEDETNTMDGDSSNDEDEGQAWEDLDNCNGSESMNDETDMIPTLDEAEVEQVKRKEQVSV